MKNTIEIKIECKGEAVGTLGWFNSIIEKSELVIKNRKNGLPGMFLVTNNEDKTISTRFVCCVKDSEEDEMYFKVVKDNYIRVYNQVDDYGYKNGLFNFPLTPSCSKKVVEFLDSAVEKFAEWWENQ